MMSIEILTQKLEQLRRDIERIKTRFEGVKSEHGLAYAIDGYGARLVVHSELEKWASRLDRAALEYKNRPDKLRDLIMKDLGKTEARIFSLINTDEMNNRQTDATGLYALNRWRSFLNEVLRDAFNVEEITKPVEWH